VDIPDGGLSSLGRRQIQARETVLEDIRAVGVSGMKGDRPRGIPDPRAVEKDLVAALPRHSVEEWNVVDCGPDRSWGQRCELTGIIVEGIDDLVEMVATA
jgi:hypothetical protein